MTLFATKSKMLQILLKSSQQVVTVHNPSIGLLRRGLQLGVVGSYNCNDRDFPLTTVGQTCKTEKGYAIFPKTKGQYHFTKHEAPTRLQKKTNSEAISSISQ